MLKIGRSVIEKKLGITILQFSELPIQGRSRADSKLSAVVLINLKHENSCNRKNYSIGAITAK